MKKIKRLIGENEETVEADLVDDETEFIDEMVPFFESGPWIDRISTSGLCESVLKHLELGIAAYKSRKLIKAGVVFDDDGTIYDVQFSGDFYFRPALPITSTSVLDDLANAVTGLDPEDQETLEDAIGGGAFDRPELKFPRLEPTDFAQLIIRATGNTQPVTDSIEEN